MTWVCHQTEPFDELPWPSIGAMWEMHAPSGPDAPNCEWLSPEYWRDHFPRRGPIMVMLPGRTTSGEVTSWPFCVDSKARDENGWKANGWTVTGEIPNLTVSPSINAKGVYHGWLQGGVISDGLEP